MRGEKTLKVVINHLLQKKGSAILIQLLTALFSH